MIGQLLYAAIWLGAISVPIIRIRQLMGEAQLTAAQGTCCEALVSLDTMGPAAHEGAPYGLPNEW